MFVVRKNVGAAAEGFSSGLARLQSRKEHLIEDYEAKAIARYQPFNPEPDMAEFREQF